MNIDPDAVPDYLPPDAEQLEAMLRAKCRELLANREDPSLRGTIHALLWNRGEIDSIHEVDEEEFWLSVARHASEDG